MCCAIKYITVLVLSCVVFTSQECSDSLLSNPKQIADSQFVASSIKTGTLSHHARITSNSFWCPQENDNNAWIKVNLTKTYLITGFAIQGRSKGPTLTFALLAEKKNVLHTIKGFTIIPSNRSLHKVPLNVKTKIVTIRIKSHVGYPQQCLRFDFLGCEDKTNTNTGYCKNHKCQHKCEEGFFRAICACRNGYVLERDNISCRDKNECALGEDRCDVSTTNCHNVEGSYYCSCNHPGLVLNNFGRRCVDINECDSGNGGCAQRCVNEMRSHRCECFKGYRKTSNVTCEDINECTENRYKCVRNSKCHNTPGGYKCNCLKGYKKNYFGYCVDENECSYKNGGCEQKCDNVYGSYACSCIKGFTLHPNKHDCVDNNECLTKANNCFTNTTICVNVPGGYKCKCLPGLQQQTALNCEDANECKVSNGNCMEKCHNTYASYYCSCPKGSTLHRDNHTCIDINECLGSHACQQVCRNFYNGYKCDCQQGYKLNADQKTCKDINECMINNGKGPCGYQCVNTVGSFKCVCKKGYEVDRDGRTCVDFDECSNDAGGCDKASSKCINTHGSYECRCLNGFSKNTSTGQCYAKRCSMLHPVLNGYVEPKDCTTNEAKQFKDVCTFKCNLGYKLNAKSVRTASCNADGNWNLMGGYQPKCEAVHCNRVSAVNNGIIVPETCLTEGSNYGQYCRLYCKQGYTLVGSRELQCMEDGFYDGTFGISRCIKKRKLICPSDIRIALPIGAEDTILPLERLGGQIDFENLKSIPDGVLDERYRFKPQVHSQAVKLISPFGDECVFHVKVEDREPPKVVNCPIDDIFVTVLGMKGVVSWPEPSFSDNVNVTKIIKNVENHQVLPQQVYFVFYAAQDAFGNEAVCRFFVHVRAKYCSKETMPGGEHSIKVWFPGSNNQHLNVFLSCPSNRIFSQNLTVTSIFYCYDGFWRNRQIPDCVERADLVNGSCVIGYQQTFNSVANRMQCGKCPKGTRFSVRQENCEKCPKGTYQDEEGISECKKCPNGTTTSAEGEKSVEACQLLCPPGGYSISGMHEKSGCNRCPDGSYQNLYGQVSCKLCKYGGNSVEGADSKEHCKLPARISKIIPSDEVIKAATGKNITVDCYATGIPAPFLTVAKYDRIVQATGRISTASLVTGNAYITGIQLRISNASVADSAIYKCRAGNKMKSSGGVDVRNIYVNVS